MTVYSAELALNRFGFGSRGDELSRVRKAPEKWLLDQLVPLSYSNTPWTSEKAIEGYVYHRRMKSKEKDHAVKSSVSDKIQRAEKTNRANKSKKDARSVAESSLVDVSMTDYSIGDSGMMDGSYVMPTNLKSSSMAMQKKDSKTTRKGLLNQARKLTLDTVTHAITTQHSFQARLLDFFSNHFSVSENNLKMRLLAPTLEREAIAPNLVGNFSTMLLAVETHPAMIIYLNNEQSAGPDTRAAKRKLGRGLNENLAREILELHTLGVDGGYKQSDVRELAMAISGWSVNLPHKNQSVGFAFKKPMHQPGTRTIMGKKYAQQGFDQGKRILQDLAAHPSTARFMSLKLARHFVSDRPPTDVVDAMTSQWIKTGGDLKAVITAMLRHPKSWKKNLEKFKTPREFIISACRACEQEGARRPGTLRALTLLGQRPFSAGSPAGFGDASADWDGAEALIARIEWADHMSASVNKDPLVMAKQCLGELLTDRTEQAIRRAESRQQGLALFLMSPEFQRR